MRCIDGDALKRKAQRAATEAWKMKVTGKVETILNQFIDWVNNAPTIEPERKVGKWIDQKGGGCCCSECGRYALDEVDGNFIHVAAKSNYCPNCGAKMDGSE